ncbi:hypothetical protein A2335_04640 [Candidatus Peregrinibacteria bacterium RIFOXYB2_FULL_32_7]|nr:MAG: hypothetical protein A2335_04640 [Candidatus Peregrinibacteria bacterium RIFOXYB2_FULL_32_7]
MHLKIFQKFSFTLIEIIIVITLIGILSSAGFGSYNNFKYRFSFEAQYQELFGYFQNARQMALTGKKQKYEDLGMKNIENYDISIVKNSGDVYFRGIFSNEEVDLGEEIDLASLKISNRYKINFLNGKGETAPFNSIYNCSIDFYVDKNGAKIYADGEKPEIIIELQDLKIPDRKKGIYINALSGIAEEI